MSDPIMSPDGKWMWTGNDWIPAPPGSNPGPQSNINLSDSMMSGDMNVEQGSGQATSSVNLKDSSMSGDINITQNSSSDIIAGIEHLLKGMGFSGQSSPDSLTPAQEAEVEKVLEISDQLAESGIEIDPWTEYNLGEAASLAGRTHSAEQHYLRAAKAFKENGNNIALSWTLKECANIHRTRGNRVEAVRIYYECLEYARAENEIKLEIMLLNDLASCARAAGEYDEAKHLIEKGLELSRKSGNEASMASSYRGLGLYYYEIGNMVMAEQIYREGLSYVENTEHTDITYQLKSHIAYCRYIAKDYHESELLYQEILNYDEQKGDVHDIAISKQSLALIAMDRNELQKAYQLTTDSLNQFRKIGDRWSEAESLSTLARIKNKQNNYAESERLYRESLAISEEIQNVRQQADTLVSIGLIVQNKGEIDESERLNSKSLELYRNTGNKRKIADTLVNLAVIAQSRNDPDEQRRLNTEAVSIWRELGSPIDQWYIDNGY